MSVRSLHSINNLHKGVIIRIALSKRTVEPISIPAGNKRSVNGTYTSMECAYIRSRTFKYNLPAGSFFSGDEEDDIDKRDGADEVRVRCVC